MTEFNDSAVSAEAVRGQLARVLESSLFVQSERLGRFLRYAVEYALSGTEKALKEYKIGVEVYDRKPPYHPNQDSIVRSEARRLRSKLKEYYEFDGKDDPIFIYFRTGSYVPVFRSRLALDGEQENEPAKEAEADRGLFAEGAGVSFAVVPFLDLSGGQMSLACANGISDELVHRLMRTEGCRVIATSSMAQLGHQAFDITSLVNRFGVQFVMEGTVREQGKRLRVTSRAVKADGFQIWSQQFEIEANPERLFIIQEQIASALVSRIAPRDSAIRRFNKSIGPGILTLYPSLLSAEALLEDGTLADMQAALAIFLDIVKASPEFARAHCGVSQCYYGMAQRGVPGSAALVAKAKEAATAALALDENMIEAHSALACSLAMAWRWQDAETSYNRAVSLGSHHITYREFAIFLSALGRFYEAWRYLTLAQQMDPFSYRQKAAYARSLYYSRRYNEADEYFSRPATYGPLPTEVLAYHALAEIQLGHYDEAKAIGRVIQRDAGGHPTYTTVVAEIFARCGEIPVATAMAAEFGLLTPSAPTSSFRKAALSMALGNPSGALTHLLESQRNREAELPWLAVDPRFDSLRETPECREIVEGVRAGASS